MNKKEEFFTARRKALSTYGRYDFALLSDKYYGAKFADTGKYSLQGTTQGNGLTGGVPPVRFSM